MLKVTQLVKKIIPQFLRNYYHFFQSLLANLYYGFPGRKLKIIGVTGTDGKTTTVNLIYHLLKTAGHKVSMISTVSAMIGDQSFDTGFHVTTPDPWLVPKYLAQAVKAGSEYMVLEVTSHALDQHRMAGIRYDVGVITNITHEHLDYHKTYEKYLKAKAKLLKKSKIIVLNADDQPYHRLEIVINKKRGKIVFSYGIKKEADFEAEEPVFSADKTEFALTFDRTNLVNKLGNRQLTKRKTVRVKFISRLLGDYNLSNILAALTVCLSLDIDPQKLVAGVATFKSVIGRLEGVETGRDFKVIVDFAHTPGAFAKVLPLVQTLAEKNNGRLIHIFGCAGLRDHLKRPIMGEISGQHADTTILTAEDPRTEDVNDIINEIAEGCRKAGMREIGRNREKRKKGIEEQRDQEVEETKKQGSKETEGKGKEHVFYRIPDRQEAISLAIQKVTRKGDIVLITGKGHEKSMCFGETEYPWSEHEAVKKALNFRN